MSNVKILVVEDEKIVAKDIQIRLKSFGYSVPAFASSGEEAVRMADEYKPDLVLMDIMLDGQMDGVEAAGRIREAHNIPVVYLTAYSDDSTLKRAMMTEPFGYILKPFEERELYTTIEMALYKHKMETRLKESEQRFATTLKCIGDAVIATDSDRNVTFINPVAEDLVGWKREEAIGNKLHEVFSTIDEGHAIPSETPATKALQKSSAIIVENHTLISKDGKKIPIDMNASPIRDEKDRLAGVVLVFRNISERKRIEEQIREQAALLNKTRDAIGVIDLEGKILFWNDSSERIYGWKSSEVVGKNESLLYKDPLATDEALTSVLEKGEWSGELNQVTKDGKDVTVESRWSLVTNEAGRPKTILIINTDITEKKRLAAQYLRSQRMDSIGTLAGGIAHDLNNVLAPIMMSVQILRKRLSDERAIHILNTLEESAQRGADMVKQVLSFARGVEGKRINLLPKHLINDLGKMLSETFPKSIQIETYVSKDLHTVLGDATQLYQVMMNLCVNSRDAMPNGGKLTITAENSYLDANYAQMQLDVKPGRYVLISVSDSGLGIPAHLADKIFEPFFTTKEFGKGTGLGLSTALAITKSHDGFINVYNEEGKGATFKIYLPASEAESAKQHTYVNAEAPIGNGELIFVVDDEAPIRQITKATLEAYGYEVLTASDGAEAVAVYAANKTRINAVVMDMMMPYMDGLAAIRALQKLDPKVKIIAASGLVSASNMAELAGDCVKAFLPKPYTADKLLRALADALQSN